MYSSINIQSLDASMIEHKDIRFILMINNTIKYELFIYLYKHNNKIEKMDALNLYFDRK